MQFINNQKGAAPILFLLAALGIIIYLLISSVLPFKEKLFNYLYPKPPSHAATSTNTSYNMGVLVIKYFPLTSDGQNIDINVTGDVGDSYTIIKKRTDDVTNQLKLSLEKASTYLGYKDSNATPSLKYTIVDTKEYTQAVPLDSTNRRPVYTQILNGNNICDYVDNKGVTEVWMWAYQGPTYPGSQYPYLNISESKMSGPYGDISNSYRGNDMSVCQHTYRLYTFNYQRYTSEALESWGHQIEAEMDAIDKNLYRNIFQGPNYPQTLGVNGRCGSVHNPPNARSEYDRANPIPQKSDCLDWNPDSLGTLSDISCSNWGCQDIDPVSNNASLNYQIWMLQNMPGRGNVKTYQGKSLRNWWDVHGDFDNVMGSDKTLIFIPTSTPTPTPSTAPSPSSTAPSSPVPSITPSPSVSPSLTPSPSPKPSVSSSPSPTSSPSPSSSTTTTKTPLPTSTPKPSATVTSAPTSSPHTTSSSVTSTTALKPTPIPASTNTLNKTALELIRERANNLPLPTTRSVTNQKNNLITQPSFKLPELKREEPSPSPKPGIIDKFVDLFTQGITQLLKIFRLLK